PHQATDAMMRSSLECAGELEMTAIDSTGRSTQWGVGTAIGTSAAILLGHLGPFVGTALLASLPSLLFAVVAPASRWQILVDLVVAQIVAVTLIYGTVQALRGRQVSMSECISQGFARLGTAIGVAILVGIGVALGLVVLIGAGLFFGVMGGDRE